MGRIVSANMLAGNIGLQQVGRRKNNELFVHY